MPSLKKINQSLSLYSYVCNELKKEMGWGRWGNSKDTSAILRSGWLVFCELARSVKFWIISKNVSVTYKILVCGIQVIKWFIIKELNNIEISKTLWGGWMMFLGVFCLLQSCFAVCRSNISCNCLGMNLGWGTEGLSLVCWACSLSVLAGLCACVSHDVLPFATLNPFKALLSFSSKGKAFKRSFPALLLQKDHFFQKQKGSTSLTWGIQLVCQGTSNTWQLLKISFVFVLLALSCGSPENCCAHPAGDASRPFPKGEQNFSPWKGLGRCGHIQLYRPEHHLLMLFN